MDKERWLKIALILAIITIGYNILEGIFSVFFGASDETLALFGFGTDSFVEVISGAGVLHMVVRMRKNRMNDIPMHDRFEQQALRVTGVAFYLLTLGLAAGVILNILYQNKPETTRAGIVISIISIAAMYGLMRLKLTAGKRLRSEAIIADAACTRTCFYLSFILLLSSIIYEIFKIPWIDIAGSSGIAWFAFTEGREAFVKARNTNIKCSCQN